MNQTFSILRLPRTLQLVAMLVIVTVLAFVLSHAPGAAGVPAFGMAVAIGAFVDAQCNLSDAQALTATAYTTNTYDTTAAGNAFDIGDPVCIAFSVDVAAKTSNNDETYQLQVVQSANADLSSHDVLVQTDTTFLARAKFVAGSKWYLPLPPGFKTKRYIGGRFVLGGTSPTMTITAFIQPLSMIQNDYINANGFLIDS